MVEATETKVAGELQIVALDLVRESALNPRHHIDQRAMDELTESIRIHGVMTPLLVRPNGDGYEIAAGNRRRRAAKNAGLTEVPIISRPMDDVTFLEILTIENLQRENLTPLEEAEGYRLLMTKGRYNVERIAERVGKSGKYIYDRVKLLQLVPEAKTLLLSGHISAGHAILLARLKPDEQQRAIDPDSGGLFQDEQAELFDVPVEASIPGKALPDEVKYRGMKARSVRELEGWIDQHVRFDRDAPIVRDLFPETAAAVKAAVEEKEKVVQITHNHFTPLDAKEGNTERIYHTTSWTLADGSKGHKTCDRSVTGVIVVGPDRGKAFKVCIDKQKCAVHWATEQRQSKTLASRGHQGAQESYKQEQARRNAELDKAEAERNRWKKALPAILKAVADKVQKAPARAKGFLGDLIIAACKPNAWGLKVDYQTVPRGTTAEDLVRHAAFLVLQDEAASWQGIQNFPKRAKALGVDVRKILDEAAPVAVEKEEKPVMAQKLRKDGKEGKVNTSKKAGKPAKPKVQTSGKKAGKKKAA